MTTITIVDESTASAKCSWNLDFLEVTVSLRELIRRRIYQEVTEYNARKVGYFHGLVQPTEAERTLNGSHLAPAHRVNWQAQYEKAVEAFLHHAYIVLVDGRQIADLDTSITLTAATEVTFLKLVPLVGG